jgi:Glycosyl transferases group 1
MLEMKYLKAFLRRIIHLINILGLGSGPNFFGKVGESELDISRILIVGPGSISIPPTGWGAIETIIHESVPTLRRAGFETWLLNSQSYLTWQKAKKVEFDLILNYFDPNAGRVICFFPETPKVSVCQYGFINSPNKWPKSYWKCWKKMTKFNSIVLMNDEMVKTLQPLSPTTRFIVSSNGSGFDPEIGRKLDGPFLCLGKVEERKAQYELFQKFSEQKVPIQFIGQIEDRRVIESMKVDPGLSAVFLGEKSREELKTILKDYCALILLSHGEADALVLYEAQLSGLPIFMTAHGKGAQDINLPWINLIDFETSPRDISSMLAKIEEPAQEIAQYARLNYNWNVKNAPLIEELSRQVRMSR